MMIRIAAMALLLLGVGLPTLATADEFAQRASWTPRTREEIKQQVDEYLKGKEVDELTKLKLEALWPEEGSTAKIEPLDLLCTTLATVDPDMNTLIGHIRNEADPAVKPDFKVLSDKAKPDLVRNNARLLYARWFAQNDMYNEALEQMEGLTAEDVVDPATLLFYQSVGHHRLVQKDKCLPILKQLLENEEKIPNRYRQLAMLMEADIQPLKTDSLDEIARIMRNIQGRLGMGRAGKRVRDEEQAVIAKFDKLIEEMEKAGGGGGGGGGGGAGSKAGSKPSSPMQDSQLGGAKGAGDVERKKIGEKEDWGDLPPKEKQAALAELSKDLPAHYRAVIEEYFRKIARDER